MESRDAGDFFAVINIVILINGINSLLKVYKKQLSVLVVLPIDKTRRI